jgi:hypothetical protein
MHAPVPWIALAAIAAMFVLPWLDARGLFDGPHTIRRRPHRQVCAECAAPWTPDHQCPAWWVAAVREPLVPLQPPQPPELPEPRQLSARLTRPDHAALLPRRARA